MRVLLDTQLLVWVTTQPDRLPSSATAIIEDMTNDIAFSAVSIWEVAIKFALRLPTFDVDPASLRRALMTNGYDELDLTSAHAIGVASLPLVHRDPFDRVLIAQANAEDMTFLTTDRTIARYPGAIRLV